nr:TonB family protein [Dysgonomonas sp. Marseille-P4361]
MQTPPVSPAGDLESFQKWVQANVRYTDQMKSDGIRGEVILSFAIDKKGKLIDKKVIGKLSEEADKEALRVLSSSSAWKPGVHDGKSMKTTMIISISFGNE